MNPDLARASLAELAAWAKAHGVPLELLLASLVIAEMRRWR